MYLRGEYKFFLMHKLFFNNLKTSWLGSTLTSDYRLMLILYLYSLNVQFNY